MPKDYRVLPNFAASIARREPLHVYGHGKQTRTFCYITDAIIGFSKIILDTKTPDVFNVGNPKPEISITDLAKMVNSIVGNSNKGLVLSVYPSSYPEDEPNRRCPDITKISQTLQYDPQVTLKDGLERFLTWSKKNYFADIL